MEPIEFILPEEKPEPVNEFHRRLLEQVEGEATETAFSDSVKIKVQDIQWY